MRLTVIGSGDAFGTGGRFNTCFMVESDRRILLDCGASSPVALRARGIDCNTIEGVMLSHLHGDHFGGLPFLLLDAQLPSRRESPLVIAGPPGTRERLNAALEVFFPRSSTMTWRFPLEIVEIPVGAPTHLLGFDVRTAEVIHRSGAPSTAVRLSDGKHVLAYSGDTEWTDALFPIAEGADLFIAECYEYSRATTGHMTWTVLKSRLPELRAKRIMITHMNASMLAHVEEARSAGVLVAEDGMTLDVK
jgi:ribonuclease BN (tRNA processing enzyme)